MEKLQYFKPPESLKADYKRFAENMKRELIAETLHSYVVSESSDGNVQVSGKRDRKTYEGEQQQKAEVSRLKLELRVLKMGMNMEQDDKKHTISKVQDSLKRLDEKIDAKTKRHAKEI